MIPGRGDWICRVLGRTGGSGGAVQHAGSEMDSTAAFMSISKTEATATSSPNGRRRVICGEGLL